MRHLDDEDLDAIGVLLDAAILDRLNRMEHRIMATLAVDHPARRDRRRPAPRRSAARSSGAVMATPRKRGLARKIATKFAATRNSTSYQQPAAPIPSGVGSTSRTPIAPSRAHPEAAPYRPYITG